MYFPRQSPNSGADIQQPVVANENADVSALPESQQLQNSFAGKLGHAIEPVIRPLGFDWKIGVALIASFAAREVLVSTLSIIYNVGKDENERIGIADQRRFRNAKKPDGSLVWTPLTALS